MIGLPIIGSLIDGVVNYFTISKESKNKIKEAKALSSLNEIKRKDELKQAQQQASIARLAKADKTEADYDIIAQENSKTSYIDEIEVLWVLAIVTMVFIPITQPYVINGFKSLSNDVPVFFQLVFVGIFISKLGLRFLFSGRNIFK